ncbi:hypothetical protein T11_4076 [Trichinella zimbabwensis]|uniref:Uncharacterized protein n=1 Tax=Trichinella zimbabwensis TaxID=268475 RepID=A0A0V1GAJ6_9BILA|nr:hypothetical protein T11_4076 [Trichinella zimbabwensis]
MPPKHGIQRAISLNRYSTENYPEYDKNDNSKVNRV